MISDLVNRLRQQSPVSLNEGVSLERIAKVEEQIGMQLPNEVREFYSLSDGADFDDGASQVLSLEKALELKQAMEDYGIRRMWNYLPFTEENTSNPICVCCSEPLIGYLVHVFHDDGPVIKWRDFKSFLKIMLSQIEKREYFFEDAPYEFSSLERKPQDIATARKLLEVVQVENINIVDRDDGCNFAAWLFGHDQLNDIARLLETEDEFVRRDVCCRLKSFKSRAAGEVLRKYNEEMESFVNRCKGLLEKANVQSEINEKTQLQVLHPTRWLNMDAFFTERRRTDFETYFVSRVTELIKLN